MIGSRTRSVLAAAVLGTAALAGCAELGEPVVVTIGPRAVTAREIREWNADRAAQDRLPLSSREDRNRCVQAFVDASLLVEYAEGLLTAPDSDLPDRIHRAREEARVERLQILLGSEASPDSVAVADAYRTMSTTHRVQIVRFGTEAEAAAARSRIEQGEPFEDFLDPSDARSEYWATWSPLPDVVGDALPELEIGEMHGPERNRGAWFLLRIIERRDIDPGPFGEARSMVLRGLQVRANIERAKELLVTLREKAGIRIEPEAVDRLAAATRRAILAADATEDDQDWAVPRLEPDESDRPAATWNGGTFTLTDYATMVAGVARGQRPRAPVLDQRIQEVLETALDEILLSQEAERRRLGEDFWVQRLERRRREEILVTAAMEDIVDRAPQAAVSDSLLTLLRESQPQIFRRDDRARILRFDLPTRDAALREIEAIRRAGSGQARLREIVESPRPLGANFHLLDLERRSTPDLPLRQEIFEGGPGSISGPHELLGSWVAIVCLDVEPGRELSTEEMQELLGTRGSGPGAGAVAEWLADRRRQVGVEVDPEALDTLAPGA